MPTLADAMAMLKRQAEITPPPQWVRVVGGFTKHQFAEKRLPTLDEINAAAPETPVFILHLYDCALLNATAPLLLGQMVFLVLFLLAGVAAAPITAADAPLAILAGMLGVTAMAIQNAASRTAFATLAPTTVMTGNVTQIVIDLVDLARAGTAGDEARGRLRKMGPAVAAFAVGALADAIGHAQWGFWCLAVPIVAVPCSSSIPAKRPERRPIGRSAGSLLFLSRRGAARTVPFPPQERAGENAT